MKFWRRIGFGFIFMGILGLFEIISDGEIILPPIIIFLGLIFLGYLSLKKGYK